jgi:hypothetical protein
MNKSNKFTPGPWSVEKVMRTMTNVSKGTTSQHAEFKVNGPSKWSEEDARLIATAPEMLAILEDTLCVLFAQGVAPLLQDDIAEIIARATGGANE